MAFTQSDLDLVNAAIARGEMMVVFRDRTVQYRSVTELLRARAAIIADLAAVTGVKRMTLGVSDKGLA